MRMASYSTQFQRDVKRLQKRGKDLDKLKKLVAHCFPESPCL